MLEDLREDLERLVELYAEVKFLVLDNEAQDVEQKSNIAVFNEMRAALDHVIRCVGDDLAETPEGSDFRKNQLRKANEHIIRAGYDSLDGIGILIRKRISERMKGLDETSIAHSFPEYFSEHVSKIEDFDKKIRESRDNRNKNGNPKESMAEYKSIVEDMKSMYAEIGVNLEHIGNYDRLVSDNSKFKVEIQKFSSDAISTICPQYYSDYNDSVVELGKMLKRKAFKTEKNKYDEMVEKVNDMQDKMINLFPELALFDKKRRNNSIIKWIFAIVGTIVGTIAGAIIGAMAL